MTDLRKNPPSDKPNNQDVFIWALFVLGGADQEIDVEDIYLKAFELAPARLSWRTRSDLPDYKKTSKALQSVEAKTHVGLVHKTHPNARRLTSDGVAWVERYRSLFEKVYSAGPVAAADTNLHERRRRAVKATAAWGNWLRDSSLDLLRLSEAFSCQASSPIAIWRSRVQEISRAGQVLEDKQLVEFAESVSRFITEELEKK